MIATLAGTPKLLKITEQRELLLWVSDCNRYGDDSQKDNDTSLRSWRSTRQRLDSYDTDKQFLENDNPEVLLPHFSCHSLRHTFTTRMCEAGVNVKVIQDALGHKDVSTTLNIYTDVTKELRKSEFEGLELQFNQ